MKIIKLGLTKSDMWPYTAVLTCANCGTEFQLEVEHDASAWSLRLPEGGSVVALVRCPNQDCDTELEFPAPLGQAVAWPDEEPDVEEMAPREPYVADVANVANNVEPHAEPLWSTHVDGVEER